MNHVLKKIRVPKWLKNKFALTVLLFFIWMLFFDQNDIVSQFQLRYEIHQLEEQKAFYTEQIKVTQQDLENLLSNDAKLEKFAREKYLMKKPDEEIFIIVPEKK